MPARPKANGADGGRAPGGRFAAGNPGGPGNPYARRVATLRTALLDAVTVDDLGELARALVAKAKEGDAAAARLVLAYLVGTPTAAPDPDRLDVAEAELEEERREAKEHAELFRL